MTYLNIHTVINPGGEIRAQGEKADGAAPPRRPCPGVSAAAR
jgi:hypothetical protein